MKFSKYMGISHKTKYTTNELSNIFSKFTNLKMGDYYIDHKFIDLMGEQNSSLVIKFINMFKDINEFEYSYGDDHDTYSLAGTVICMIRFSNEAKQVCICKIMDHLLKLNMDMSQMYFIVKRMNGIDRFGYKYYNNKQNHDAVMYMVNNYNVIQNVRKIMNNHDIILFDIINDLQFIELILLISKSRHKIVPKFIITYVILYYYLLDRNIEYNKDDSIN